MAKQTGDILLYGTHFGACGYILQDGNAIFVRKPGPRPGKGEWSRLVTAGRVRFGCRSEEAAQVWRRLPGRLRLLAGEHGYHEFLRRMLLGNGRMAGFSLSPDVPEDGVSCLVGGRGGEIGQDTGTMGRVFPRSVVVIGDKGLGSYSVSDAGFRMADFLPAGGHHVTGGMSRARSKARKRVLARLWNAGLGLQDRKEMEAGKWDNAARGKGFGVAEDWFRAMAVNLCNGDFAQRKGPDEGRILMRVVVGCCHGKQAWGGGKVNAGSGKVWSWQGGWQPAAGGEEVELPRWHSGAVFAGVEFGYVRRGVVVPLRCLNRVWCVGVWHDDGKCKAESRSGVHERLWSFEQEIQFVSHKEQAVLSWQASGGP